MDRQRDPLKDGISKVELLGVFGTDLTVVNAARVSMHKESEWEFDPEANLGFGGYKLSERDVKLIAYLARHNHWTPFSHPQVSLRIKMPLFVARQWFKHQVGFTRNEVSRRYVDEQPEFYVPTEWRKRAPNVKQGSSDELADVAVPGFPLATMRTAASCYSALLKDGVCPEQARMVLPQSTYTEFIETGSLAAYARLARLRMDPHAQLETRQYAKAVADLIAPRFPVSWKELLSCATS